MLQRLKSIRVTRWCELRNDEPAELERSSGEVRLKSKSGEADAPPPPLRVSTSLYDEAGCGSRFFGAGD